MINKYNNGSWVKVLYVAIAVFLIYLIASYYTSDNKINTQTVQQLNIKSYMGKWYEIARFNHNFEKGLSNVTAEYSLLDDGKIQIINTGIQKNKNTGQIITERIEGKAKQPDKTDPGKLKVSFFVLFRVNYYILSLFNAHGENISNKTIPNNLSPNYEYALVGSNSPNYLWILSRTPTIPSDIKNIIIKEAEKRGYNIKKLIIQP